MMPPEHDSLGPHLRLLRCARGLSLDQTAERAGLSVDSLRELEDGHISPALDTLRRLCGVFDLRLSALFEGLERGSSRPELD